MHHPAWSHLLDWLNTHGLYSALDLPVEASSTSAGGGYGLLALKEIPPLTPLFTIPATALLNLNTLSPHYPKAKPKLTSVQIISLHLFLHRPTERTSSEPLFGPYIAVLPAEFDTHPLSWYTKRSQQDAPSSWLLARLPPFVRRDLERVAKTWQSDWERVRSFLESNPKVLETSTNPNARNVLTDPVSMEDDFLWAWLNVNTRCIYYRIKESKADPDNLTLCPILDFANHSSVERSMTPRASDADIWDMPWKKRVPEDFTLLSPANKTVKPTEELFLRYGFHSNQFLFVEYGFASGVSKEAVLRGEESFDVDITPVVEDLISSKGEVGEWMRERLLEEGYWGEWTLHASPTPAHPSYRLITALRLCSLFPLQVDDIKELGDAEERLAQWRAVTNGEVETISKAHEAAWRSTLGQVCRKVIDSATAQIEVLEWGAPQGLDEGSLRSVLSLWNEERYVAKAVLNSVEEGVTF